MSTTHCPQCGKELPAQGKFCKYCGCPVNSVRPMFPVGKSKAKNN